MTVSLAEFLRHLTDSGLMTAGELRDLQAAKPADHDSPEAARRIADDLVSRNRLTRYQADTLLSGSSNGLVYGNYVVLDPLGQGGMGLVYKAEHRKMRRRVALKILSPRALKSEDSIRRFRREVEAAARLIHPNIVAAYDADEAHGAHFLVMELVAGKDLAVRVKQHGPLPVREAVGYVIQAASGLDHAHKAGIVHRDIKPANLLLDESGTVKVLDLGMARLDDSLSLTSSAAATITHTGSIMGTIDFMSPEQALDTRHVDRRADIYSLGCSLYYLLTGRPLFTADTLMKKLLAHREQPIPSLRAQRAEVSLELETVFTRMVAKRPEDRFQTMAEVIHALQQTGDLASGSPMTLPGASPGEHHSTLYPAQLPVIALPGETCAVKKGSTDLFILDGSVPMGATRPIAKPVPAPDFRPVNAASASRSLSRRQWGALFLSAGLLFGMAAVPWFRADHRSLPRNKDESRSDTRTIAGQNTQPEERTTEPVDQRNRILVPADGWIDLWSLINVESDVVFGKWRRHDDVLTAIDPIGDAVAARLMLPCRPAADYELTFRIKRLEGESGVVLVLPVAGASVAVVISGFPHLPAETMPLTGLHLLDGKPLPLSPERVRGPILKSGRAYLAQVRVTTDGTDAGISLEIDDDRILDWKGTSNRLEVAPQYQIPDRRNVGFGVFNATVEIHDVEFRVLKGEAFLGTGEIP